MSGRRYVGDERRNAIERGGGAMKRRNVGGGEPAAKSERCREIFIT